MANNPTFWQGYNGRNTITGASIFEQLPRAIRDKVEVYLDRDLVGIKFIVHVRPVGDPRKLASFPVPTGMKTVELPEEFIARLCVMV